MISYEDNIKNDLSGPIILIGLIIWGVIGVILVSCYIYFTYKSGTEEERRKSVNNANIMLILLAIHISLILLMGCLSGHCSNIFMLPFLLTQ